MPNETPSPAVPGTFAAIVQQKGGTIAAVFLAVGGVGEILLGADVLSPRLQGLVHGVVILAAALANYVMNRKQTRTTDILVTTQAENKIQSPLLAAESKDPAVQREIEKQVSGGEGTANGLLTDAQKLQQALEDFNPDTLSPDRILATAKAIFPDRIATALWVNLLTGKLDEGATFEVWRNDKFSADALAGHLSAGAALGYKFAQAGNISASIFAGATHPYSGVLTSGWSPVLGAKLKF